MPDIIVCYRTKLSRSSALGGLWLSSAAPPSIFRGSEFIDNKECAEVRPEPADQGCARNAPFRVDVRIRQKASST